MRIYKSPNARFKYVFDFAYDPQMVDFCRSVRDKVGLGNFRFEEGKWRFNNPDIANFICAQHPSAEIDRSMYEDMVLFEAEKTKKMFQEKRALEIKQRTDSSLSIPRLKGELRGYQKVGVEFFDNANGRAILSDQMGSGKSLQALAYIVYKKLDKALVICTASTKYSWEGEVQKWTGLRSYVVDKEDGNTFDFKKAAEAQVVIINYDILKKNADRIKSYYWDIAVLDEFQSIKNSQAQRTRYAKEIVARIPRVLLLSGTPMLSRPAELFNGLNILDPQRWGSYYDYTRRYCDGHEGFWGWEAKGATHIDELQANIEKYFLRRRKEDILKELPPKNHIDIPVSLDKESRGLYAEAEDEMIDFLVEVKNKRVITRRVVKEDTGEEDEYSQANKLKKLNALRQITSLGKVWAAQELIANLLEAGEKILVFSVYHAPLQKLQEALGEEITCYFTGEISAKERSAIVEEFQNPASPKKVFLGGIKSAGVGITLTAASSVIFIDYSWVPADHDQAQDRCFYAGTPILTKNGWVPIEKIKIGDKVISASGRENKITDIWSREPRRKEDKFTCVLNLSGFGEIKCTSTHRFLLDSGEWKEAQFLLPGDTLRMPGNEESEEKKEITFDLDCRIKREFLNKATGVEQKKGTLTKVMIPEKIPLTDDFLFLLGYYAGDGFSSVSPIKGKFVSLSGNGRSKKIPMEICRKFFISQGIHENERIAGNSVERRYYHGEWAKWFYKHFGHGAKNKILPEFCLELNIRQSEHVLNGLLSSDGYRREHGDYCEYITSSNRLAAQVFILATRCGLRPSKRYLTTGENLIGFYLIPEDKKRMTKNEKELGFISSHTPGRVISNTVSFSKKYDRVYDITVETEENFVAGGVVAHNCHRIGQKAQQINIYQLFSRGTIDEDMQQILARKKKLFSRLIDGETMNTGNQANLIEDLLKVLADKKKNNKPNKKKNEKSRLSPNLTGRRVGTHQ